MKMIEINLRRRYMIYVMGEKRMNSLDAYIWFKNYQILYFGDMLKI